MKSLPYKFAHLHVHSDHSPLDAPVPLKKLVKYSKKLGYGTVALTDHGTISGWVKLASYCKDEGLKPIFGIETYFCRNRFVKSGGREAWHLILLAKNNEGIKNIMRLSELAWTEGEYYVPRIDWELLEKYHEGIICTSACIGGVIADIASMPKDDPFLAEIKATDGYTVAKSYAQRFKNIFGKDYKLEIQYHGIEKEIEMYGNVAKIAKELDIGLVGTNDVHYLEKKDANLQEIFMAIAMKKYLKDPKRIKHDTNQLYLKSPDEMCEIFGGYNSEAVQNALEIADSCNATLNKKLQLPSIEIPKEHNSPIDFLKYLIRQGMDKRGYSGKKEYEDRINEEMAVIEQLMKTGVPFDRYFLLVWDIINFARSKKIKVGIGRGSGAGSLILNCLNITGLDPLKYDLLFERFLTPDRNELPDIDTDFESERYDEIIDYIRNKFGLPKVGRIGTTNCYHVANAIKVAFKVFDPGNQYEKEQKLDLMKKASKENGKLASIDDKSRDETFAIANEITKQLPIDPNSGRPSGKCTFSKEEYEKKKDELLYVYDTPAMVAYKTKYPEIFETAEMLEGLISGHGIHAAGIVMTEDDLCTLAPQHKVGAEKNLATVFDMSDVEKVGLIKIDALRTKGLSVLSRCENLIKQRYGIEIDVDQLTDDDEKALEIFANGDTDGIFQFESDGMRKMLRDMGSITFEDVVAANALYRPGPMQFVPDYCARKTKKQKVSFFVEATKDILNKTLGIIVYQEQVMKMVRKLAGFTGSEADKIRKAMGKKKRDILDQMRPKFIEGCLKLNTCSEDQANKLWRDFEAFGAYAFNKSHSAAYAFQAYQCAYLKAHYPEEFMASQLSVEAKDACYEVVAQYERSVKNMGIKLLPLDINFSNDDYIVVDEGGKKAIRKGFNGIKGLGNKIALEIVKNRPYKNIFNFCVKTGISSEAFMALNESGAFDSLFKQITDIKQRRAAVIKEFNSLEKSIAEERKAANSPERKNMKSMFADDDDGINL